MTGCVASLVIIKHWNAVFAQFLKWSCYMQGCGAGVGFLTTLGVGAGFFCPTPDVQLDHFLHHTPKLGIHVEMVQFLKLIETHISCCAPRFPSILTS